MYVPRSLEVNVYPSGLSPGSTSGPALVQHGSSNMSGSECQACAGCSGQDSAYKHTMQGMHAKMQQMHARCCTRTQSATDAYATHMVPNAREMCKGCNLGMHGATPVCLDGGTFPGCRITG